MESNSGTYDAWYSDPRDAYRNGFIDAVLHLRGISSPTGVQLEDAIAVLGHFRASQPMFDDGPRTAQSVPRMAKPFVS